MLLLTINTISRGHTLARTAQDWCALLLCWLSLAVALSAELWANERVRDAESESVRGTRSSALWATACVQGRACAESQPTWAWESEINVYMRLYVCTVRCSCVCMYAMGSLTPLCCCTRAFSAVTCALPAGRCQHHSEPSTDDDLAAGWHDIDCTLHSSPKIKFRMPVFVQSNLFVLLLWLAASDRHVVAMVAEQHTFAELSVNLAASALQNFSSVPN